VGGSSCVPLLEQAEKLLCIACDIVCPFGLEPDVVVLCERVDCVRWAVAGCSCPPELLLLAPLLAAAASSTKKRSTGSLAPSQSQVSVRNGSIAVGR
jgi:hypothetical protein